MDHPEFEKIVDWIRANGKTHSVASLRIDQITPELLSQIKDCGHKTITVAPEAGTERLRKIINKQITDDQIFKAMEMIGASDIPRLKLYFQVGLPFEEDADIEAIPVLLSRMKSSLQKGWGKRNWATAIQASINPFVPKPGTPFQWRSMADQKHLKKKLGFLRKEMRKLGGVTVTNASPKEASLQALIARGDRRTAGAIVDSIEAGQSLIHTLRKSNANIPDERWYNLRERTQDEILPWEFIDNGVTKKYLYKEYEKAKAGKVTPPCDTENCRRCDACK